MTMRERLEASASEFLDTIAAPAAERVRDTADVVMGRIGSDARQLGERLGAQLSDLPDAALRRFDVVPARRARRRTLVGFLAGLSVGALLMYFFDRSRGAERREALMARLGLGAPQPAAANTED